MGPYCKFCGRRCFVPITYEWPEHIRAAYGTSTIAATCLRGQEFEQEKIGVSYADIDGRTLMSCGHKSDTITNDTLAPMCSGCGNVETMVVDV